MPKQGTVLRLGMLVSPLQTHIIMYFCEILYCPNETNYLNGMHIFIDFLTEVCPPGMEYLLTASVLIAEKIYEVTDGEGLETTSNTEICSTKFF